MGDVIEGITGIILVGGKSRRMGRDKAFIPWEGRPLFEKVLDIFTRSFAEILLVGGDEERFGSYHLPLVQDLYPGSALGGLYTGLYHASTPHVFVAPCDMPYPSERLLRSLCSLREGYDAVVPETAQALEPLYAVYGKECLPHMRRLLECDNFRVYDLYPMINTRYLAGDGLLAAGGDGKALVNVNTPDEFAAVADTVEAGNGDSLELSAFIRHDP